MSFTNAQLAQKISDLIDFWSSFNEEYKNWLGGEVDGGPGSDGDYPLTDYTGTESLVACPAKLEDDVDGYVGLASASASAAAASEAAAATSESNAATSAATATAQAVLADADRVAAELAETNAQDSAVTATAQANLATLRVDYAEEWANKAFESLVSAAAGGDQVDDYSALHWATVAEAFAGSVDSGLYGQLAQAETVTGRWTFDGLFPYFNDGAAARGGTWMMAYDTTNADYIYIVHNGSQGILATAGAGGGDIALTPASGLVTVSANIQTSGGTFSYSVSATQAVADYGQVGQLSFMDVSGSISRFGGYNFDTASWQSTKIEGSTVEVDANAGFLNLTGTSGIYLNHNTTVRTGKSFAINDSTNADSATFYHTGADLVTAFVNTTNWSLTGGVRLRLYSPTAATNMYFTQTETQSQWVADESVYIYAHFDTLARYTLKITPTGTYLGLGDRFTLYDIAGTDQFWFDSAAAEARVVTTANNPINFYIASVKAAGFDASALRLSSSGHNAIQYSDAWLRLNNDDDFTLGTYTPGLFRADGGLQVDGVTVWSVSATGGMVTNQISNFNATVNVNSASLSVNDGYWVMAKDATNADYVYMYHSGSHGYVTTAGAGGGNLYLAPAGGIVGALAGASLAAFNAANTKAVHMTHNDTVAHFNDTGAGGFDFDSNGTLKFFIRNNWVGSYVPLKILEAASAASDSAGYGQFWTKTATPNEPWFTDDDGGDQLLDPSRSEINTQNAAYTLILGDKGKTIHKATSTASITHTIPANASVAFAIGTLVSFKNSGTVDMTIAITTDTLTGTDGSAGSRTLGAYQTACIRKLTATTWEYVASDL